MATKALIVVVLVLAGCASTRTVWSRDGASDMDFRRDRYECGRENTWAAGGSGLPGALAIQEAKAEAERGWRRVHGDSRLDSQGGRGLIAPGIPGI